MSVTEILEAVRALSPAEQAQVKALLNMLPSASVTQMTEDEFEQYLAAKGKATIPAPITAEERQRAQAEFDSYKPITVSGVPLSQIIIEERR